MSSKPAVPCNVIHHHHHAPGANVAAPAVESIEAAHKAVMAIVSSSAGDEVKRTALVALRDLCSVNASFKDCYFASGERKDRTQAQEA